LEVLLASAFVLAGVVMLVAVITLNVVDSTPERLYMPVTYLVLQLLLAVTLIGIGTYRLIVSLWMFIASAERRGALVIQAGDLELIKDLRGTDDDLPTIPAATATLPLPGKRLPFRLRASKRNFWRLITGGVLCLLFVALAAVLVITGFHKFRIEDSDWIAGVLAIPISVAALWTFHNFVRQFLQLTSIGPTNLEVSEIPVFPGKTTQVVLSQPGRMRLKLLDVLLECVEEATYNLGTNIRTERRVVYSQRLFRKRGVEIDSKHPFEAKFDLTVPDGAMHSFSSSSNRITWQITIRGQATGFPTVVRNFEIIVFPRSDDHAGSARHQIHQSA
jgi:hypothetical protein